MTHPARVPRVTFQGEAGAYSEDAVAQRWGSDAEALPCRTFAEALTRVATGEADHAVIPVWNSTVGAVDAAVAALDDESERLQEVERILVPVRHCLLALSGTEAGDVRYVGSHPMALRQCTRFFAAYPAVAAREAYDTGGAALELARHLSRGGADEGWGGRRPWYDDIRDVPAGELAVIASARAAARHGLRLLLTDIQDEPDNSTCFVVVRPLEVDRW